MINPASNVQIILSTRFNTQLKKVPDEIKATFSETLELFRENPLDPDPNLRSHPLKDKYAGYRSIDITGDWRALFKVRKSKLKTVITFYILGTHDLLYG